MLNSPITIITACWRSDNVKTVIKTVEDQTFKNVQHILINDGSPKVREVFKANNYFINDKNRHIIDNFKRCHYYGAIARNIGIVVAFSYLQERDVENEWLCFLDDDNSWEPDHLQSMVDEVNKNPEATLIASDAIWVGVNDKSWRAEKKCVIRHGKCDLGQFLYRTSLFKKYGHFNPRPEKKQCYDFELIKKMDNGEGDGLVFTNKPTFIMSYRKQ